MQTIFELAGENGGCKYRGAPIAGGKFPALLMFFQLEYFMVSSRLQRLTRALRNTLALSALLVGGLAQAQSGTVKLMVGFPAGGGTDAIARILAEKLKDQLGTTVIVDNRAGAGGADCSASPQGSTGRRQYLFSVA